MTDRLVCAVDATAQSAGAVCAGVAIGNALGMRIVLVYVAEPGREPIEALRSRGLADLERSLVGLPVPADAVRRAEVGDPAEQVVAAADEEGAALILAGTRPAGARAKAVFGSVTTRIVELAAMPVVIAPQACCESALAGDPWTTHEVIIAVDGSEESRAAAALAGRMARRARVAVVLAHVVPPLPPAAAPPVAVVPPITDADQHAGWRILADARDVIPDPDDVEVELRQGVPAREIDRLARERGSDLIALGTRRPGRFRRLLAGSIADDLAASGERLVMVIPDDVARREYQQLTERRAVR